MNYFNDLRESEKEYAVAFFRALKQLSKDEVTFLSEKYITDEGTAFRVELGDYMTCRPITDTDMADSLGVSMLDYQKKRSRIELKLKSFMQKELDGIEENKRQNLTIYVLKMNNLYLKKFSISPFGRVEEEITFTQNIDKAMQFKKDDPQGEQLKHGFGLTKEEPFGHEFSIDVYVDGVNSYVEWLLKQVTINE